MTKLLLTALSLTTFFCNCSNQFLENRNPVTIKKDTVKYSGLQGTWVRHNKEGFTLIEIKDTSNISFYSFGDRKAEIDTITTDRYWYYKSTATLGYWDSSTIWISTDKFRFDYKIKGDTLIEFDKMGDQGKFIKVYTDEQKAFKAFNDANLKGKITFLSRVNSSEFFVLDNLNWEYSFSSIANKSFGDKLFSNLASIGDRVIKPAYADVLILYKNDTKKYLKFAFVRR